MVATRQQQIEAGQTPSIKEHELPPGPQIEPQWSWVWRCWHRLHPDRPHYGGGMGPAVPGSIPWMVLRVWADTHHYTEVEFTMLDRLIQALDAEYIGWWSDQQRRQADAAAHSPRNRNAL